MPTHTEGHEANLLVGTHIQSFRMSGPLGGVPGVPAAGHPLCAFVPLSLFALGGADPSGGFCLRTLSFGRPMAIV
jgi:hypothetical protein